MMRICSLAALLLASAALAGCQKVSSEVSSPPVPQTNTISRPAAPVPFAPTNALRRLSTMKLLIGPEVITAELALTGEQLQTGMMFRKSMPENEGMLFVFAVPVRASFYMRNTTVPLTAAYLDSEGTILELRELKPLDETPVVATTDNVQFVLEMNRGWFERHQLSPGARVTTERGDLRDAFRMSRP
jgi:uncharacterized membrane protein (UPF0127 family)